MYQEHLEEIRNLIDKSDPILPEYELETIRVKGYDEDYPPVFNRNEDVLEDDEPFEDIEVDDEDDWG